MTFNLSINERRLHVNFPGEQFVGELHFWQIYAGYEILFVVIFQFKNSVV